MATLKKRINLTVDEKLYQELEALRRLRNAPSLASVVTELTQEALELQEDRYFATIAEQREKEDTISHQQLWKKQA